MTRQGAARLPVGKVLFSKTANRAFRRAGLAGFMHAGARD